MSLFSKQKGRQESVADTSMSALVGALVSELVESSGGQSDAPFVLPDVPPAKVQGVRAKRSCGFVEAPTSVSDMLIAVLAVQPLETYTHWLLQTQRDELWLSRDPLKRPLVNLVSEQHSPAIQAVCRYTDMLLKPPAELETVSLLDGSWPASEFCYIFFPINMCE